MSEIIEACANCKSLQASIDAANQMLYDNKRQMNTWPALEGEYQEEIKILQEKGTLEQQKLQAKVQELEEFINCLRVANTERVGDLEAELANKEEETNELKKQIENLKNTTVPTSTADEKLLDELSDLKQENFELKENIAELEVSLEDDKKQTLILQQVCKNLEEELESYKETLKYKREELNEAKTLLQNAKDELLCVKSELDAVKAKPQDDNTRGNSLFAEVDDRRVQLQKNMKIMRSQYMEMKREKASFQKQITALRHENILLVKKWEAEVLTKEDNDDKILNTYKNQIKTLNDLIDSYRKEMELKAPTEDSPAVVKFCEQMLTTKNNAIEDLRKKLSASILQHTGLTHELIEVNTQLTTCNIINHKLQNEVKELKMRIEEIESTKKETQLEEKVSEEQVTLHQPKSIIKSTKSVHSDAENDEMDENRKVRFSETTVEPKNADKITCRRGAKVLIAKPVMF